MATYASPAAQINSVGYYYETGNTYTMGTVPNAIPVTLYPTKDIWKALWLAISKDLAAGNAITAGVTTYSVYGITYTVSANQTGLPAAVNFYANPVPLPGNYTTNTAKNGNPATAPLHAYGKISVTDPNGAAYNFPNYIVPSGTTSTTYEYEPV